MCDCLNNRVQLFTSEGVFVDMFGSEGRGNGQFWRPMGVAVDSENRIIVVDQGKRQQCFLVCLPTESMVGKQSFIVCTSSGNMVRKQCFLVCPPLRNMAGKQ